MAKEKEKSPQEGLQENKLKALQAAMDKDRERLWTRCYYAYGR